MRVELFDYELPEERIARHPAPERDRSRLLVVDPMREALDDRTVGDLPELLPAGALLVLNDTRVLRARLLGEKAGSGGKVEIFLVERLDGSASRERWRALGRASKPLRPGGAVLLAGGALVARVEAKHDDDGTLEVALETTDGGAVAAAIEAHGQVPLPPYLRRDAEAADAERYQTVFARVPGAVAAPTAGLHLTLELMKRLRERGIVMATLTLHVGLGTFQPVTADDLDEHPMHAERYEVPPALVEAVAAARARGKPVVAVGTTVVRALESAADPERPGHVTARAGSTRLLIQPGDDLRVVDALLTNFHLPRSTLLALVSAFVGRERLLAAYREAIARGYRFYSYGDAMLIPRRAASGETA